mgnify:CR=1 FL=1
MLPNLGRVISVFLACLIAFGSGRYSSFFLQSGWAFLPIAIPLICLILHDFSLKPSIKQYFYYTSTLTLAMMLGSTMIVVHLVVFSCGFFLVLAFFEKWHQNWTVFRSKFGRFIDQEFIFLELGERLLSISNPRRAVRRVLTRAYAFPTSHPDALCDARPRACARVGRHGVGEPEIATPLS